MQTVLPTTNAGIKAKIAETNTWITRKKEAKLFTIIDIHSLFKDENGLMKKEYTYDGTHLTEAGYTVWVTKLKTYFK